MVKLASPPLRPAIRQHLALAGAQARWRAAVAGGDRLTALEAAEEALACGNASLQLRTWRIDSLLRAGRPDEALSALAEIEAEEGPSHESRFQAANLAYYRSDYALAAQACAEAIVLLPLSKKPTAQYSTVVRFWAECLCLAGSHDEARRILERCLAFKDPWSTEDIRALRKTVVDEASLADFRAFLAPYFSFAGVRSRAALYHFSMACRDLKLYDQAEMAIRQRYLTAARLVPFGHRPPSAAPKPAWVADARRTLTDLKSVMDGQRVEFFLISGTLLGAVREGDILGHDKDIDVGVLETPDVDKGALEAAFSKSGRFSVKPYQVPSLLRVQHASGVMVDVFWHREEDGLIIHEGMKSKWWNSAFDLIDIPFLGDTYRGPRNYARYLGENYGNWEKPDAEFETFVDTPNMVVTSEGEIVWYYYCKLLDYHIQGKVPQFRKVGKALARLRPKDRLVQAMVHSTLAGRITAPPTLFEDEPPLDEIAFDGVLGGEAEAGDETEPQPTSEAPVPVTENGETIEEGETEEDAETAETEEKA